MKRNRIWIVLAATLLLLALVLMACADDAQGIAPAEAAPDVVEASVAAADQDEPAQDQDEPEQDEDNDEDQDQDEDKDDEGDDEDEPDDPGDEEPVLATASVVSRLSNQAGRSIVSARGNHFVVDSVPPLDN
ncbi:MAG: hypothetical protein R3300_12275, partial [Candidatus Promineifilaceae bacterium]|nr:hypothetical protein [Candidatus Promineifilaceae bacterium]